MQSLSQGGALMKKLFLAGVSLVALNAGGSALAADLPVKAPPPPPPVYSWTGCYGGGFVGYGWGKSQHRSLDPRQVPQSGLPIFASESDGKAISGDITPSFHMSGTLGGFNVGCQYQIGWWFIGVEGDGAATNNGRKTTVSLEDAFRQSLKEIAGKHGMSRHELR
jgi:outer membrane immunogenic protein